MNHQWGKKHLQDFNQILQDKEINQILLEDKIMNNLFLIQVSD